MDTNRIHGPAGVNAESGGRTRLMASGDFAYAAGSDTLRVGLVGCGGRGTGAAAQAVQAAPGVEVYAMGDLFKDRADQSRILLQDAIGDQLTVTSNRVFAGFDNYLHVIDSGVDIVILASPPYFRPEQLRASVEAGKHVFFEKPVAVDPPGAEHIIETGEMARQKGLSLVTGTIYRRQPSFVEAIQRIHDGMIGDIVAAEEYYLTGTHWLRPRQPGMSDMEWQCRNWYYFTWLAGDQIVEQFVHNLDVIDWVMQSHPVRARGTGGRQVRVDPSFGNIYDHFCVEYEYPNGARVMAMCRQIDGGDRYVANRIVGTRGIADVNPSGSVIRSHDGSVLFELQADARAVNPYVAEHADLINSIRSGQPINEARQIAESTLTGILGREAVYTGQDLTWDQIRQASELRLGPDRLAFASVPFSPVAMPGETTLSRNW